MASDTRADETHDTRYETNFIFHLGRHCNANFDGWFNSHYPLVSSRSESGEKTTKDVTKHGDVNNEAKIKKRQPRCSGCRFLVRNSQLERRPIWLANPRQDTDDAKPLLRHA